LWSVLGFGQPLVRWGWNGRKISAATARGIFIAALGSFVAAFGGGGAD